MVFQKQNHPAPSTLATLAAVAFIFFVVSCAQEVAAQEQLASLVKYFLHFYSF
jgi:hypothetical protein